MPSNPLESALSGFTKNFFKNIMRTKFICVSPISFKAKVKFSDLMDQFHSCRVIMEKDDKVFLESLNKSYHFWMNISNDNDWKVVK